MALFIMKWMDLSLKECRMQRLSFLRASPVFLFRSAWYRASRNILSMISSRSKQKYRKGAKSLFKSSLSIWECIVSLAPWLQLFGSYVGRYSWRVELGHWAAKVPWTYGSLFSWSKIQFRLLELLQQRSNSMPLLEESDLSILRVSRAR